MEADGFSRNNGGSRQDRSSWIQEDGKNSDESLLSSLLWLPVGDEKSVGSGWLWSVRSGGGTAMVTL